MDSLVAWSQGRLPGALHAFLFSRPVLAADEDRAYPTDGNMFPSLLSPVLNFLFPREPYVSALSCNFTVFCVAAAYFLLFFVSKHIGTLEPTALQLKPKDKVEWHARLLSTLSACLIIAVSITAVPRALQYTDRECYFGYSPEQDIACRLFLGFLLFDVWFMWAYRKILEDPTFNMMIFHHVLFIVMGTVGMAGSYFRYQALWLMAGEASNPLINIRWHLAVLDRKGLWYLLNGVAACVVFGATRVVLFGMGLRHMYRSRAVWLADDAPAVFLPTGILLCCAYVLNIIWFVMILQALGRTLRRRRGKKPMKKKSQ